MKFRIEKPKTRRFAELAAAFLLPALLMTAVCACLGVAPFGPKTLFIQDMENQYLDYFSYLKTIFSGDNNVFYSFSKCLGGEMAGLTAYYLLSPFNLVFLLFNSAHFAPAIWLLYALKLGGCGLCCALWLRCIRPQGKGVLLFSTAYALMSYAGIYGSNIMWLDGVMVLPLVAMGLDMLCEGRGGLLYTIALAYALVTNYYIGYMLCIFSVLYFLFRFFAEKGTATGKGAGRFVLYSVLAGALAAFVLVPTFLSLSGTKASFDPSRLTFELNFRLRDFCAKLFAGAISYSELVGGLPNVFCGTVTLLGAVLFFTSRDVKRREKLLAGAFLAVLALSFFINAFDLVWHGFNYPSCFYYRYSFIFSLFLVYLAWRAAEHVGSVRWYAPAIAAAVLCAVCFVPSVSELDFWGGTERWVNLALLVCGGAAIVWLCRRDRSGAAAVILAVVQLVSVGFNAFELRDLPMPDEASYAKRVGETRACTDFIRDLDGGFYRVESQVGRTDNDPMHYDYGGVTHFSSTGRSEVHEFMTRLGFMSTELWTDYALGSTSAADSLLGIRYLMAGTARKPYAPVGSTGAITVYENANALPLVYPVAESCLNVPEGSDPFAYQNELLRAVSGVESAVFTAVSCELDYENLDVMELDAGIKCSVTDPAQPASVHFRVVCDSTDTLYASFDTPRMRPADVYVNGEYVSHYFTEYATGIVCLGHFAPGETADVELRLAEDGLMLSHAYICKESAPALAEHLQALTTSPDSVLTRLSSSHLRWQGTADEPMLLFTLPYEKGWHIRVDGKTVEPQKALGVLMAVGTGTGYHEVDARFTPPGLIAGCGISAAALIALVLLQRIKRKEK